ncbi:MAG: hypothetical protein R2834_05110 [Rhodothermales bacterium]
MTLSYIINALTSLDSQMLYATIVWGTAALIAGLAFRKCLKEA